MSDAQPCDCAAEVDAVLVTHNARLRRVVHSGASSVLVAVEKIKPDGTPSPVMASAYCPFCGIRYGASQ